MYLVNKRLFDIAGKLEVIRNEHVKIFYKNLADLFFFVIPFLWIEKKIRTIIFLY